MQGLIRTLALVLLLVVGSAASSQAGGWVVDKVSEPANYSTDNETWSPLVAGMTIPEASWIHTGKRGRLILRRDRETILFKPGTLATIATHSSGGIARTDVSQRSGALLLDVRTLRTKHTTVHTPFLAAVVKGTRFEVEVGQTAATLRVERGVVEARNLARGQSVDVTAGQLVEVTADPSQPMHVEGDGPKAKVRQTEVEVARVEPAAEDFTSESEVEQAGLLPPRAGGGRGKGALLAAAAVAVAGAAVAGVAAIAGNRRS